MMDKQINLSIIFGMIFIITVGAIFFMLTSDHVYALDNDSANSSQEDDNLNIFLNDEKLEFEVDPVIEEGRTLVPFRKLAESIGVQVNWIAAEDKIVAESENLELTMVLGSRTAKLNGEEVDLDVAPKVVEGRTLIPLRHFSETFDVRVEYENGQISMIPMEDIILDGKTLSGFYAHGYEGRSSWEEVFGAPYPDVGHSPRADLFNSMHLGWFEISPEGELISSGARHGFRRPGGYEDVLEKLEQKNIDRNLTVFATQESLEESGDLIGLFRDEDSKKDLMEDIVKELDADAYSGVNLDIEGLGRGKDEEELNKIREKYVEFVKELEDKLGQNKQMVVTVHPPNSIYEGYDFEKLGEIADKLVVMAYDYHDRSMPSATAPIDKVEEGIEELKEKVPGEKIVLGIRLPAVKYAEAGETNDSGVNDNVELYDKLEEEPLEEDEVTQEWIITHPYLDSVFDFKEAENLEKNWDGSLAVHYLKFEDDAGKQNYIYFETKRSLLYKWDLIDRYDLRGVSFWRLGAVPEFVYEQVDEVLK